MSPSTTSLPRSPAESEACRAIRAHIRSARWSATSGCNNRRAEIDAALEAVAPAGENPQRHVLIHGEARSGRSSVLSEIARRAAGEHRRLVVWLHGEETRYTPQTLPSHLLIAIVEQERYELTARVLDRVIPTLALQEVVKAWRGIAPASLLLYLPGRAAKDSLLQIPPACLPQLFELQAAIYAEQEPTRMAEIVDCCRRTEAAALITAAEWVTEAYTWHQGRWTRPRGERHRPWTTAVGAPVFHALKTAIGAFKSINLVRSGE